ncbi:MAG: type II toxin-antitoxin system HicA family toxin [Betaproteobacteria bacterium]|nr:type II toxin-antitoxin system HicA family toxin [Betaproteobacteria bacterium]
MDSRKLIKLLEADGWYLVRVSGSHHQFKHPNTPGLVTVKHPDPDIPKDTRQYQAAGWMEMKGMEV